MDLIARKWLLRAAYALFFLLVMGLSVAGTLRFLVHSGEDVDVPVLVGKTVAEAETLLAGNGLRLEVQGSQYNEQSPDGMVVHQMIAAGESVRAGRNVGVYLSKGGRELLAPRVIGLTLDAAKSILESSDLSETLSSVTCSDEFADGVVVAQDPLPGGAAEKGRVALLRSDGPCRNRFVMADLAGRDVREVLKDFDRDGFVIRSFRYVERDDVNPRTILEADPPQGTVVHPYDSIVFTLASASEKKAPQGEGSLHYVVVPISPGLFKRPAQLWLDREETEGSSSIDFLATPGENAKFILWITPGSQVALTVGGRELWRKGF